MKYKLSYYGGTFFIMELVGNDGAKFWQQISPNYYRKGNALNWAKKKSIKL